MKKFAMGLMGLAMVFSFTLAHADNSVINQDAPFHVGFFPSEQPLNEVWVNPPYSTISALNPSCQGERFVIANTPYDFTH